MTAINLRAAEARELIDAGRVEVVRVIPLPNLSCPFPAAGSVVACREKHWIVERDGQGIDMPFFVYDDEWGDHYVKPETPLRIWQSQYSTYGPRSAATMPNWAIRLHARVESRSAEVRDGKWFWVAVLVRVEKP